ncbi:hypothetical protein GCM10007304_16730 [Rhodococcoides trifolii]|uniref:Nitrile hydratase beta subunit-like N-terminal domain-containing protein n=1 Tax=Rhodococcoides trifolii TaxID=908250 RepID=A0A917CYW3_9NOCA|nr:nitrile hydratase accessory protein [Rhodococcus trifolii]GGG03305.1 hypothetical protein GCM10007304_16730 [Rhodococcus trifolii]
MTECSQLSSDELADIRERSARPAPDGDEPFRLPWELRSFALAVAYFESRGFPWTDFQHRLVAAIAESEVTNAPEQYYERWVEALLAQVSETDGVDIDDLDRRTAEILATPRDATHQHAHDGPAAVDHAH